MFKKLLLGLGVVLGCATLSTAATAAEAKIGVVNFASCVTESKLGQQEQSSFEALKTQLSGSLEDLEKQINEISVKFNDKEYLEGLSPEAEDEMKNKFRALNEDLARNQNQFYQLLNQANMRIVQTINANITMAAEKIAKEKKISMVVNKEAMFYYSPTLDITSDVVAQMDKSYDEYQAKQAAAQKADGQDEPKEEAK